MPKDGEGIPEMDAANGTGAFACPHCGHSIQMPQQQNLGIPYQINKYGPPDTGFGRLVGAGLTRAVNIAAPILQDAARKKAAE